MNYNDQTEVSGWTCANCSEWVPMNRSHTCPTVPWEKLVENQIQIPPEFVELVDKHFWELV